MKVELLAPPRPPIENQLGQQLRSLASEQCFTRLRALVAFVKKAGVARVQEELRAFRDRRGEVQFVVGIDQGGTGRQGLEALLKCADRVVFFPDPTRQRTFHPKVYLAEGQAGAATVIIGSGNTTAGGLFTNYEANVRVELDLRDGGPQEDRTFYEQVEELFAFYEDLSSGAARQLDSELLDALIEGGALGPEQGHSDSGEFGPAAGYVAEKSATPDLFGSVTGLLGLPSVGGAKATQGASSAAVVPLPSTARPFYKVLSWNDINPKSSPGQIVIPIRFRECFPEGQLVRGPDPGGGGRKWESFFPVVFRDGDFSKQVPESRFIVYEPKRHHPRRNTECRFTLRNRELLRRLEQDDILVFRPTPDESALFEIERLRPGSSDYTALYSGSGRRGRYRFLAS